MPVCERLSSLDLLEGEDCEVSLPISDKLTKLNIVKGPRLISSLHRKVCSSKNGKNSIISFCPKAKRQETEWNRSESDEDSIPEDGSLPAGGSLQALCPVAWLTSSAALVTTTETLLESRDPRLAVDRTSNAKVKLSIKCSSRNQHPIGSNLNSTSFPTQSQNLTPENEPIIPKRAYSAQQSLTLIDYPQGLHNGEEISYDKHGSSSMSHKEDNYEDCRAPHNLEQLEQIKKSNCGPQNLRSGVPAIPAQRMCLAEDAGSLSEVAIRSDLKSMGLKYLFKSTSKPSVFLTLQSYKELQRRQALDTTKGRYPTSILLSPTRTITNHPSALPSTPSQKKVSFSPNVLCFIATSKK